MPHAHGHSTERPQPRTCSSSSARATSSSQPGQRTSRCSQLVARCSVRALRLPTHGQPDALNWQAHRMLATSAAANRSGTASSLVAGDRQHGQRAPEWIRASSRQQRQNMCLRAHKCARSRGDHAGRTPSRALAHPHKSRVGSRKTSKQMPQTKLGSGASTGGSDAMCGGLVPKMSTHNDHETPRKERRPRTRRAYPVTLLIRKNDPLGFKIPLIFCPPGAAPREGGFASRELAFGKCKPPGGLRLAQNPLYSCTVTDSRVWSLLGRGLNTRQLCSGSRSRTKQNFIQNHTINQSRNSY